MIQSRPNRALQLRCVSEALVVAAVAGASPLILTALLLPALRALRAPQPAMATRQLITLAFMVSSFSPSA